MKRWLGLISRTVGVAAVMLGAFGALAQQKDSVVQLRGEITNVDGRQVTVQTRDGTSRLEVANDATIFALVPTDVKSLKPEAMVGVAGVPDSGERIKATLVILIPEGTRGQSDGYITWDLTPDSTMRHGVVRTLASESSGHVITMAYPQGGATVVIPPGATIVSLNPGDTGLLKKGAHVYAPAAKRESDNRLSAKVVAVGKEGLKPPM